MKFLFCLLFSSAAFAAQVVPHPANPTEVRIVPVQPTPEPDNVQINIQFPKNGQLVFQEPVNVQVRLLGFPIGTNSDFERRKEIYNDPEGQSVLIFIDDYHPIEIYKPFIDALQPNNLYYDQTLYIAIPFQLNEGMHVIRAFPDRSYGESLKGPGNYTASTFYTGEKKDNLNVNLSAPYLTYNEPLETLVYTASKPLLLDFYITNTQLSQDGYKVRVDIDGTVTRVLTRWLPYYIYGLSAGTHTIRLQLIDEKNKVVPGLFNDVTRTITIQ